MRYLIASSLILLAACDVGGRNVFPNPDGSVTTYNDMSHPVGWDASNPGCESEFSGCYTVYAHTANVLYRIDLAKKLLVEVGPFNAPEVGGKEDTMTDLAVSPNDVIYVISKSSIYTADAQDGHVTLVGAVGDQLKNCGGDAVALTFMPDGKLYAGDHVEGNFCRINLVPSPTVEKLGAIGGGLGFAGDIVAVADGTIYATVWDPSDAKTAKNNSLAKIDPVTGAGLQTIGATGSGNLFGIAFEQGKVFGFTSDGSGNVVTIDPATGKGTVYGTFTDPNTGDGISFWGAGVNSRVEPIIG